MAQKQTNRVGTVEEYVALMKAGGNDASFYMLLDCEVSGARYKYNGVEGVLDRGELYYYLRGRPRFSEATLTNIVKAYAEVNGEIRLCLWASDAVAIFSNKEERDMLKRILGDAKYTISVNSL